MQLEKSTSTRQEILMLMKTKGSLTVSILAEKLGITEMGVRRHLQTLERDQYIQSELVRQAMGRPLHVYSLSEKGHDLFPKNYSDLTLDLLRDIEETDGRTKVEILFERREKRLEEQYRDQMKNLPFEEKIKVLADIQNSKGYMVKWERVGEGEYIFNEYNCPISQVAQAYNKACNCELSLFKKVLETNHIDQTQCLAKGGERCVYMIRESRSS